MSQTINYEQWNTAIIEYITARVPKGSAIFLDITEDDIASLGRYLTGELHDINYWMFEFYLKVKLKCYSSGVINLANIAPYTPSSSLTQPQGVALLAFMVLAAYRMEENEQATSGNYFKRLRELLRLKAEYGRPEGLVAGDEERLWKEWNTWLQFEGYLPTALQGEGPLKYIKYPISQALIRKTDKDKLNRVFTERNWSHRLDSDMVAAKIRREQTYLNHHLQELILDGTTPRYTAAIQAIFGIYEEWVEGGGSYKQPSSFNSHVSETGLTNLAAGVYRVEDSRLGSVNYYLHPRLHRRANLFRDSLTLHKTDQCYSLEVDSEHPSWFLPSFELDLTEIEQGANYLLVGHPQARQVQLTGRNFRVFTPDPQNPDWGAYAEWEAPRLGTPFIILCKTELSGQLEYLQEEGLLRWSGQPQPIRNTEQWIEYRNVMVISANWSGIRIGNQELYDKLCPRESINISLEGGIRAPHYNAWLTGYGPQLKLFFTKQSQIKVIITNTIENEIVAERLIDRGEEWDFQWKEPGIYLVEALSETGHREISVRQVQIIGWEKLEAWPLEHS